MKKFYFLTILIFVISNCAGVQITKITPDNRYAEGIRFYRPQPYLWVTQDTSGNLQASIIWLPNMNEEYTIRVRSGIGSTNTQFTLENGWNLTQFGENRDSKSVEMVGAPTGLLETLKRPAVKGKREELSPGLYVLIFNDTTGMIESIEPVKFK